MTPTGTPLPDPVEFELGEPPADHAPPGFSPLARRASLTLLSALAAGLAVCWLVPQAGLLLVWPVLFLVPGWIVVERVAPQLPAPGRVGLAIVISVYGSAHLVNVLARVGGFGRLSVLASVGLLLMAGVLLARLHHPWLAPPAIPSFARIGSGLRRDAPAWLAAAAVSGMVLVILGLNGWHETPAGVVSGGWNWSDLLVHVSIGSSIEHGNFPPEVPYFSGVPLTYHWFADFHGAIAATAGGVEIIPVYFLTSALFAGVLALLVWTLALVLTGRRRVAVIATILVCFGGGMGWLRLIGDLMAGAGSPTDLISAGSYDNSWAGEWPFFRIASMLSTGFLPHRATTLGLPGLVGAVALVVGCLGRRPAGVLLAGLLAALLAPFHFFAFPATYLIVLLYFLASGAWRSRTVARDAFLFLAPTVAAVPFIAGAVVQQSDLGAFRPVLGWSEARFRDGPVAVAFFYLTNLGLPFLLALMAILAGRELPRRWFLGAWTVALFLVPNLVVVSAVEFDMNKYFQVMWIAVAILAAWLIHRWRVAAIAAVLALSSVSPLLAGLWHLWSDGVVLTGPQLAAGRWIDANTPDTAVFVTDAWINSPIDLAGRRRVSTFGPYAANLGYDPTQREADIKTVYCGGADEAAVAMTRYGATYVLSSGGDPGCAAEPTDFVDSRWFETVYDVDGVRVWRLRGP